MRRKAFIVLLLMGCADLLMGQRYGGRGGGGGGREVHIRALYDDQHRMMVIACHNTDNGDGWEREQEFQYFFRQFSEKRAYPLGINIVFYTMTH